MAAIKLNGRDVNASALNRFSDFQGGPLGNSSAGGSARLTVDVSPTSFSYVVIAPNGGFVTSGTGIGLVFDALNRPIGGTITSLIEQSTIKLTGGPIAKRSYEVTDIEVEASAFLGGNFGDLVFTNNDQVEITLDPFGPYTLSSSVETGDGDDTVTVLSEANNGFQIRGQGVKIDTGDGNDIVNLSTDYPVNAKLEVTTGEGNDRINLNFNEANVTPVSINNLDELPVLTIKDFDLNVDRILLSDLSNLQGKWRWQIANDGDTAEIRVVGKQTDDTSTDQIAARIQLVGLRQSDVEIFNGRIIHGKDSEFAEVVITEHAKPFDDLLANPDDGSGAQNFETFTQYDRSGPLVVARVINYNYINNGVGSEKIIDDFVVREFTLDNGNGSEAEGAFHHTEIRATNLNLPKSVLKLPFDEFIKILEEKGQGIDYSTPVDDLSLEGTNEADTLIGDTGDDTLIGFDGVDTLIGKAGDDVLLGGNAIDYLDGGAGNDQLFGEAGNDQLFGGEDDDALFGGIGDDLLIGDTQFSDGKDGLFGGDGSDTAYGGGGDDYIEGGAGNDFLYGEAGSDQLLGGQGDDYIDGGDAIDVLFGNDGNDQIYGGNGGDYLLGQGGDDLIFGGNGNDTILAGIGNDTVFGENGDDVIDGGAGANTVFGGAGDDKIYAGEGNEGDVLFGGEGHDMIYGGDGDDYIVTGRGSDRVYSGNGADLVKLEAKSDFINWHDFQNGFDKIDLSFGVSQATFNAEVGMKSQLDDTATLVTYDGTSILLHDTLASDIDANDFLLSDPFIA